MRHRLSTTTIVPLVLAALLGAAGCGGDGVSSTDKAKQAYDGLDASIDKAIQLGFDGFNAAQSANIPEQSDKGDITGTMLIDGQVDQGASSNKTMNLTETLKTYSDDKIHTYDTDPAALPTLSMKLSKIPDGTLSGTLAGKFVLSGDLKGPVTLDITFNGDLQAGTGGAKVARKPGTTHITGTAKSDYGTYDVDITR